MAPVLLLLPSFASSALALQQHRQRQRQRQRRTVRQQVAGAAALLVQKAVALMTEMHAGLVNAHVVVDTGALVVVAAAAAVDHGQETPAAVGN